MIKERGGMKGEKCEGQGRVGEKGQGGEGGRGAPKGHVSIS